MISGPYYINLDYRRDRRFQVETEFNRLGIDSAVRVPAIFDKDGASGCLQSHITTINNDLLKVDATWICEDDIQFLVDRARLDIYIKEFMESDADILCLGGASRKNAEYTSNLWRTFDLQTTSSYIVKDRFKHILADFWKVIVDCRVNNSANPYKEQYDNLQVNKGDPLAADQSWKVLQQSHIFVTPKTRCIIQRASYSDIEKQDVNYGV
jgi:hypothetical protein